MFLPVIMIAIPAMLPAAEPLPNTWPGWRGPTSDGISIATGFPQTWSPDSNIAWKVEIEGRGHSSPVIWGDRVFVTTDIEGAVIPGAGAVKHKLEGQAYRHPDANGGDRKHTLKLLCFDANTGKRLWDRTAYEGRVFDDVTRFDTYASPTVVTDGKFVYTYFESQGLYKYDFAGELQWEMSLGGIATLGVGTGVSPVLAEGNIVILADQDEGENSFIAAVSARDGKIVWKTPRKNALTWTVPFVIEIEGRREIIVPSTEDVVAYDAANGKEIWKTEGLDSNVVHTPVVGHGMVYVSAGYPKKKVMAIRLAPREGESRIAWKYEKGAGYLPSPLLLGDFFYIVTDAGLVTCLDARTGEPQYEGKRFKQPSKFTSPLVAAGGMIFITSEDGDTHVVKAGPEFEVTADNSLDEPIYAGLAVVDGSIYVRAAKHLYCLRAASALHAVAPQGIR
jgi:outer membrane protein assembly factor BamB